MGGQAIEMAKSPSRAMVNDGTCCLTFSCHHLLAVLLQNGDTDRCTIHTDFVLRFSASWNTQVTY